LNGIAPGVGPGTEIPAGPMRMPVTFRVPKITSGRKKNTVFCGIFVKPSFMGRKINYKWRFYEVLLRKSTINGGFIWF